MNDTSIAYLRAQRKVKKLKGFYGSLIAYLVVNTGLAAINLLTSPQYLWFVWPLLGWGIGLTFQALATFEPFTLFSREWEEKKIQEYMYKDQQSN